MEIIIIILLVLMLMYVSYLAYWDTFKDIGCSGLKLLRDVYTSEGMLEIYECHFKEAMLAFKSAFKNIGICLLAVTAPLYIPIIILVGTIIRRHTDR